MKINKNKRNKFFKHALSIKNIHERNMYQNNRIKGRYYNMINNIESITEDDIIRFSISNDYYSTTNIFQYLHSNGYLMDFYDTLYKNKNLRMKSRKIMRNYKNNIFIDYIKKDFCDDNYISNLNDFISSSIYKGDGLTDTMLLVRYSEYDLFENEEEHKKKEIYINIAPLAASKIAQNIWRKELFEEKEVIYQFVYHMSKFSYNSTFNIERISSSQTPEYEVIIAPYNLFLITNRVESEFDHILKDGSPAKRKMITYYLKYMKKLRRNFLCGEHLKLNTKYTNETLNPKKFYTLLNMMKFDLIMKDMKKNDKSLYDNLKETHGSSVVKTNNKK